MYIKIAGIDNYAGHIVVARAQNEIYAALNNDEKNAKMYACTPDIISMVNPTTGMKITESCQWAEELPTPSTHLYACAWQNKNNKNKNVPSCFQLVHSCKVKASTWLYTHSY